MSSNKYLILFFKGFLMGVCDIIPGISGGTVAFITGIYYKLVHSITLFNKEFALKLLKLRFKEAFQQIPFDFLVPLFSGILIAIFSTSRAIHFLLENYAIYTWSVFFGLILASAIELLREVELKKLSCLINLAIGLILGFVIVGLIPVDSPNDLWFIFLAGSVAICAMILPGISGSFILLLLSKYKFITAMLLNPFDLYNLMFLSVFSLGCITGLVCFSRALKFLLDNYKAQTFALLTGFIFGALRKIWPWKHTNMNVVIRGKSYPLDESNILPTLSNETYIAISLSIFAFILVLLIMSYSRRNSTAN